MNDIGTSALWLALLVSLYGVAAPLVGVYTGRREFVRSAEHAAYVLGGLGALAAFALVYELLSRDFGVLYVYEYTSRELSWFYTISAFWAGNAGSLLLWLVILSLFTALVVYQNRHKNRELVPYVTSILMAMSLFFTCVMLVTQGSNPFALVPGGQIPANGAGLNPMLENPGMVVHPVTLYLGYVGFAIPFAFAMAALITKRLGDFWIRSTRRWTLAAWLFLTAGNILGAWWAYVTLGWGGYWAWDPVENASFLPWLTGTAFLHSVMIQEKKDMLKVWNIILIIITFSLTIFGTFLTRSGIIASVHSFGQSTLGYYFLAFLGVTLVLSLLLLFSRLDYLRSRNELDSIVSRESSFLLNNLLLVGMAGVVIWGVLYPIISEAVFGNKATVGPPFFNTVMTPLGLVLMFLTGICPLIAWRRATFSNLRKNFAYPAGAAVVVLILLLVSGVRGVYALISFTLAAFVLATIALEFARGAWVRHQMTEENVAKALVALVLRNKRRYGGYIVHAGVILLLIGVTGSYGFKQEAQQVLAKGDTLSIADYELTYESFNTFSTEEKRVGQATLTVTKDGQPLGTIVPVREYYFNKDQDWTRIDRQSTLGRDLYVSMLGYSEDSGEANIKVDINPLVSWLWIGGIVMMIGGLIAIWPDRREERRLAARYERQARLHEV